LRNPISNHPPEVSATLPRSRVDIAQHHVVIGLRQHIQALPFGRPSTPLATRASLPRIFPAQAQAPTNDGQRGAVGGDLRGGMLQMKGSSDLGAAVVLLNSVDTSFAAGRIGRLTPNYFAQFIIANAFARPQG